MLVDVGVSEIFARIGATGEALQAIVEIDLDELTAAVPPRGYGRD